MINSKTLSLIIYFIYIIFSSKSNAYDQQIYNNKKFNLKLELIENKIISKEYILKKIRKRIAAYKYEVKLEDRKLLIRKDLP